MPGDVLWVNTKLEGCAKGNFELVKEDLGISTNTEVIRYLINKAARRVRSDRRMEERWEITNAMPDTDVADVWFEDMDEGQQVQLG